MKNNKALLVIDVQEDFTGAEAKMPVNKSQATIMINKINHLCAYAKENDIPVIYIGNEYSKFDLLNIFRNFAAIKGSSGTNLDPKLNIVSDYYFPKKNNDAFSNPDLYSILAKKKINTLVITGLYAEACIWGTLKSAIKLQFNVEIFPNAIATKTDSKRSIMLKKYAKRGADILKGDSFQV